MIVFCLKIIALFLNIYVHCAILKDASFLHVPGEPFESVLFQEVHAFKIGQQVLKEFRMVI